MAHKQPTRLYSDLDLSFNINPITGDIGKKVDVNSVRQAMEILLKTKYREKPFTHQDSVPLYIQ